jgi:hypothetical protein
MGFVNAGPWMSTKYGFGQGFKIYHSGKLEESAEDRSKEIA